MALNNEEIVKNMVGRDCGDWSQDERDALKQHCKDFWKYWKTINPKEFNNLTRGRPQFEGTSKGDIKKNDSDLSKL